MGLNPAGHPSYTTCDNSLLGVKCPPWPKCVRVKPRTALWPFGSMALQHVDLDGNSWDLVLLMNVCKLMRPLVAAQE